MDWVMLAALTATNLFTCYFLFHVVQKKKPKWKEKREKICKLFSSLFSRYSWEPISLSPPTLFYCTIPERTVLFHSLLFIVPEAQVWKKRFSLLNLVFISLLTVNDNDNERTNDGISKKLNHHYYCHYFYFIQHFFPLKTTI